MNIRHIRNTTAVVGCGGKRVLIDPILDGRGAFESFPSSPRQDESNPSAGLPLAIEDIINNIDLVVLTHLHIDHFDPKTIEALPRDIKIYTQNEADASEVEGYDFTNVSVFNDVTHVGEIELIKTDVQRGHGEILKMTGHVHGLVLKRFEKPTLYLAADAVWFDGVEKTLKTHHPGIIVSNGGANQLFEGGPLVMDEHDVSKVTHTLSLVQMVVVNMEAVNHWHLSRKELSEFISSNDSGDRIVISDGGESLAFEK